jgi:hypothetical protein
MDLSVAPELAQFTQPGPAEPPASLGRTVGERAAALTVLAADPARWWDRVRFDPAAPVRVPLEAATWLLITPPGQATTCDCALATLVAGEATSGGAALRPGRTRVHSGGHTTRSGPAGYSVTIHAS